MQEFLSVFQQVNVGREIKSKFEVRKCFVKLDFQIFEPWPKSDILGKIGYLSISVFATPPGRHLIGQRRPPPDDAHISAGWTRFWLFNPQKVRN